MLNDSMSPPAAADPGVTMACKTCRWWQPPAMGVEAAVRTRAPGECHFGVPIVSHTKEHGPRMHWPPTEADGPRGWCGSHEPAVPA